MYHENLIEAKEYLTARGIGPDTAKDFRLGVVGDQQISGHEMFQGRLVIPSLGVDDSVYGMRFRAMDESEPKYLGIPGMETRLFNVRAIHYADEEIHITEGEMDAIILCSLGHPAVGVPGANAWKRHHPRMFSGFPRIVIWGDGDKAGHEFARKVGESLTVATRATMPDGMDVNDLYLAHGEAGIRKAMK